MAREDDLWAAPPASSPVQPLMGYPPYAGAVVRSPLVDDAGSRAVRTAWLERRFPDSGSRDAREATQKRRAAAALWLLTAAFVAFIGWVVVNGVPAPPDGRAPRLAEVFLVMTAVWLAIAVALAFVTRARPDVAEADVDILGRLTGSERQALVPTCVPRLLRTPTTSTWSPPPG